VDRKAVFDGVKVLEWTTAANGPWGPKIFSNFGAEVIKVESPRFPDLSRVTPPYKDNKPGYDRAPGFTGVNSGKMSITLDLDNPRGIELFKRLVSWADIVLQNQRPGVMSKKGLGYEELKKVNEDIIMINVSIAGQTGPVAEAGGWGNHSMAMGGHYFLYRFPNDPPSNPGLNAPSDCIGPIHVAIAAIAALDYRRRTGEGQCIDANQLDPMVQFLAPGILDYVVNKRVQAPIGNRNPLAAPHGAFRCKGDDKWCAVAVFTDKEWRSFCRVIGNHQWTKSPKFASLSLRHENEDELEQLVETWTMDHTPQEVMTMMQEAGVPAGIVQDAGDIVDRDPQVKQRELFPRKQHPVLGECYFTRWPFILSKTPSEVRRSPCLGEHNEYVFTKILGISDAEFVELINSQVILVGFDEVTRYF
jgi:benzylsuccinate CoA-transferase BbsF subunit